MAYGLSAIMLAVLVLLGVWQIQRLAWKEMLMTRVAERVEQAPQSLATLPSPDTWTAEAYDFTPVQLSGRWLYDRQAYWFAQIALPPADFPHADRIGFHVITPLELSSGEILMVDRGFIPTRLKDSPAAYNQAPDQFVGLVRWPSPRGRFDAADQPDRALWYVKDPQAMAAHVGLHSPAFLIEQVSAHSNWPLAGQSRLIFSNRHLEYAFTWFSLALVLVIILIVWHIRLRSAEMKR